MSHIHSSKDIKGLFPAEHVLEQFLGKKPTWSPEMLALTGSTGHHFPKRRQRPPPPGCFGCFCSTHTLRLHEGCNQGAAITVSRRLLKKEAKEPRACFN